MAATTATRHKSAHLLYRPIGLAGSIAGGVVAGQAFKQVYKRATPGAGDHAPTALESRYSLGQVVLGAALQGAVFAAVKAGVDRLGARAFQRWTGEWPGT
jgi:uncharacterized membrane protein YebE (DUF533 family)